MSFLQAEWRKLAMANFEIEPELLAAYVPYGTELDLWNGRCYVSLVGFMFLNTRLLGFPIPFHTDFEEVNLRFYVRRHENGEWKRGVVFIREIVPKPALTFVANMVYRENYVTLPMRHEWREDAEGRTVAYQWKKGGVWHQLKVTADTAASAIEAGSEAEFITEHYWGYARVDDKTTNEYQVTHPSWEQYKVRDFRIDVDFGLVYGPQFHFLNNRQPASVLLAEGSVITVEQVRKIGA